MVNSFHCRGFFFQAEDGIRDLTVTGVQTCALPILAIGGPEEPQTRLRSMLGQDLTEALIPEPVEVDLSSANETAVGDAVAEIGRASCRERVEMRVVGVPFKKKASLVFELVVLVPLQ